MWHDPERTTRSSGAAVLVPHTEAVGVADAMIEAGKNFLKTLPVWAYQDTRICTSMVKPSFESFQRRGVHGHRHR